MTFKDMLSRVRKRKTVVQPISILVNSGGPRLGPPPNTGTRAFTKDKQKELPSVLPLPGQPSVSNAEVNSATMISSSYKSRLMVRRTERIKKLFVEADKNNDGIITREEFLSMLINDYQGFKATTLQRRLGLPSDKGGSEKAIWLFKEGCYRWFARENKKADDEITFQEFSEFLEKYKKSAHNTALLRRKQYAMDGTTSNIGQLSEDEKPIMGHHNFTNAIAVALSNQNRNNKEFADEKLHPKSKLSFWDNLPGS